MATSKKIRLFTPWQELCRYGWRKVFLTRWTVTATLGSIFLSLLTPWGQHGLLESLITIHGGFLAVGLTVFGFVILGGKDDFFHPLMKSKGRDGLGALKDMVFLLWLPLLLHAAALTLCVGRSTAQTLWDTHLNCVRAWRLTYVFFALWSMLQTYFSMRYLFVLAITRLEWTKREMDQVVQATNKQAAERSRSRITQFLHQRGGKGQQAMDRPFCSGISGCAIPSSRCLHGRCLRGSGRARHARLTVLRTLRPEALSAQKRQGRAATRGQ